MNLDKMSDELECLVANMSSTQRLYCEYRSKNLSAKESARKAGSNANEDRLKNIGYQIEQMAGSKEYIVWLREQQVKYAVIDQAEILEKLRRVYNKAYDLEKLKDANESVRLMGQMVGLFGAKDNSGSSDKPLKEGSVDVSGFKDEAGTEENETTARIEKLQDMLKELNRN